MTNTEPRLEIRDIRDDIPTYYLGPKQADRKPLNPQPQPSKTDKVRVNPLIAVGFDDAETCARKAAKSR